ncbi:alpha-N-arabinofuranosidase [Duganella sp. FT80W]|uniref:non-reducing end alpha-L-arabinofuranosidase n=1 Tax=Duganella guangzhouensis TaxID=2666084 RepID=A0A6I2KWZ4_9BURK|nr:alpha-L-arabinofuranosidase C-terminal domain-containing protein [Duganella guangzhouensis]MRW88499.1 alpha-N-arabinofuranosidase [Duganella guangzhouensis]
MLNYLSSKAGTALALVTVLLGSALAYAAENSIALTVDTAKPGATIDRHIFGQFAEHLGSGIYEGIWVGHDSPIPNTRGIRNDVVAALKAIQVPVVRWPGGCFADEYHWRNGIGPADKRRAGVNGNWGNVKEPNTFGTHEFMDLVEQIGAEAYISANVGSGTPQESAEWLEYLTAEDSALAQERAANGHPAPYKVAFWGIGNESWGCGGAMSAEHYLSQLKIFSRFSRNYNGAQKMQQIAVGPDGGDTAYTETIMKAWKNKVWSWDIGGLSLHSYTLNGWPPVVKATGFGEAEYAKFIHETLGMEGLIGKHAAIMDQYDPEKKVALVVDEWGAWLAPTPGTNPGFLMQQNSQRDAILAALNLNIFARHADRVRMTNIAQMINVLQAMILTDKEKMLLTPTYHVYKMYVPFHDATLIPVRFDAGTYRFQELSMPRVDAIAARDKNGQLWLALTNLDQNQAAKVNVALLPGGTASAVGQTLSSARIDAVNTFATPNAVAPVAVNIRAVGKSLSIPLPPGSVTVVNLRP